VHSQLGNSLWQADPDFKVQFLLLVRVLLYGFHRGYLSLTLVHVLGMCYILCMSNSVIKFFFASGNVIPTSRNVSCI
jgi:hypothetical protein